MPWVTIDSVNSLENGIKTALNQKYVSKPLTGSVWMSSVWDIKQIVFRVLFQIQSKHGNQIASGEIIDNTDWVWETLWSRCFWFYQLILLTLLITFHQVVSPQQWTDKKTKKDEMKTVNNETVEVNFGHQVAQLSFGKTPVPNTLVRSSRVATSVLPVP